MDRRQFLKTSLGAAGVLAMGAGQTWGKPARKTATDRVVLGKSGVELSRLAIGTGTQGWGGSSNQTRQLGIGGLSDLFRTGYDEGVTFWEGADQYGSHPHMKEALKGVPREKVTILTKSRATTADEMRKDLDRFRRELDSDYIDILLLHCVTDPKWPAKMQGAMDVISEAHKAGRIKMHGVSCHSLGALKAAAASDWVQVDLARINPTGASMDASPEVVIPILREMKAKGKAVLGMKILGAGELVNRKDECLRFALGLDCVDAFTIGAETKEQFADLLKRIPAASA
jgi:predicted aldo/keto reductase-like oxidoreductase